MYGKDWYSLSLRYLKGYALKNGDIRRDVHIAIYDFDFRVAESALISIIKAERPSLIGFSAFVWNMDKIIHLSKNIKELLSHVKIVVGGPQVAYKPLEILAQYPSLDFIIKGEGEITFQELLLNILGKGKPLSEIDGLAYRDGDGLKENPDRAPIEDLNEIPSPYLDGCADGLPGEIAIWETFRGCVFNCAYCTWTSRKLRFYSGQRLMKELRYFIKQRANHIHIIDSDVSLNRKNLRRPFQIILKNSPPIKSMSAFMHIENLNPKDVELYAKLPLGVLEIGLQTTNPSVLKNIQRSWNKGRFERNWHIIKDDPHRKFELFIDLIIGLPGDDHESFKKSLRYVIENLKPEKVMLFLLQILRGSQLHKMTNSYGFEVEGEHSYWVKSSLSYSRLDMLKSKILAFSYYLIYMMQQTAGQFKSILIEKLKIMEFQLIESLAVWFEENPARLPHWFHTEFLAPIFTDQQWSSNLAKNDKDDFMNPQWSNFISPDSKNEMAKKNLDLGAIEKLPIDCSDLSFGQYKDYMQRRLIEALNEVMPEFMRCLVSKYGEGNNPEEWISAYHFSHFIDFIKNA